MGQIPSSLAKMLKPLLFDEQLLPERIEGECWLLLLSIFDNFKGKIWLLKVVCRNLCCCSITHFPISSFQEANCIGIRK